MGHLWKASVQSEFCSSRFCLGQAGRKGVLLGYLVWEGLAIGVRLGKESCDGVWRICNFYPD